MKKNSYTIESFDIIINMSMGQDQVPYFDVKDQDETYKILVERMVYELTRDFRLTKRRL